MHESCIERNMIKLRLKDYHEVQIDQRISPFLSL